MEEFKLEVKADSYQSAQIDQLLDISGRVLQGVWEVGLMGPALYQDVMLLLDKVMANRASLKDIGIKTKEITLWLFYEYENECNLQFLPEFLLKIAQLDIVFCISCWQKGTTIEF